MTELGRILKSIRVNKGEVLKDMSDALGVTSSYLSAVENGKRTMPEEWMVEFKCIYDLDENVMKETLNASDALRKTVKMNLEDVSASKRNAAIVFARSFEDMDDETANKIKKILFERGDE